jgi:P27 family predicted phage terminase small subunit
MANRADPKRDRRGTGNRPSTTGRSPSAEVVVSRAHALAEPPEGLPQKAHPLWHTIVAEVGTRGLKEGDLEALRMLVVAAYRHAEISAAIDQTGLIVTGRTGPVVNPLLREERAQASSYMRIADAYGLTISSRLRLGLMQLAGESILATLDRDISG